MNEWLEYVDDDHITINLGAMCKLLLRNIWIILLATILLCGGAYAISAFGITPLYQSSVKMYVNNSTNSNTSITSSDITASQNLVDTYAVVLTSRPTLDAVIEAAGVDYTYKELASMISTASIDSTEVFQVTVTSSDPVEAAAIANAIADIAPDQIMEIVSGSSVKIVEYATVATEKSSPNNLKYAAIGALLGFFLSCAGILILSLVRNGMSVEDRIRKDFKDKAVLFAIPQMGEKTKGGRKKRGRGKGREKGLDTEEDAELCEQLSFASGEAYKLLRENISFYFSENSTCKILGVTSATQSEGKSTTAINLAYTLALANKRVCLIDCDFRLPSVAKSLKLRRRPGMTNFLVGKEPGSRIIQTQKAGNASFSVITAGDTPPNPSELLGSERMRDVLIALSKNLDYIILDLPPVGIVSDALTVTKIVDGMLFVVREDFYDRRVTGEALRTLDGVEAKLLGIVVTHSTTQEKEYKRYGSKYGSKYGYQYGQYGYQQTYGANQKEEEDNDYNTSDKAGKNSSTRSGDTALADNGSRKNNRSGRSGEAKL